MKMAKATTQDMEAAMAVSHILEALCKGYLPDALEHLDSNFFDIDNHEHCREVLGLLIDQAKSACIFRVTFGMQVMLDPDNKMVDPAVSYLEHHPERVEAEKNAARYAWLTRYAYIGECFTEKGKILEVHNVEREVPVKGTVNEAIDAAMALEAEKKGGAA